MAGRSAGRSAQLNNGQARFARPVSRSFMRSLVLAIAIVA